MKYADAALVLMEAHQARLFEAAWRIVVPLLEDPNPKGGQFKKGGGHEPGGTLAAKNKPRKSKAADVKSSAKPVDKPPLGGTPPGGSGGSGGSDGGGGSGHADDDLPVWKQPIPHPDTFNDPNLSGIVRVGNYANVQVFTISDVKYLVKTVDVEARWKTAMAVHAVQNLIGFHGAATMARFHVDGRLNRHGGPASVTHCMPGQQMKEAIPAHSHLRKVVISTLNGRNVADTVTANWFLNVADRHDQNYLVNGPHIYSVDHEYAIRPRSAPAGASPHAFAREDVLVANLSNDHLATPLDLTMLRTVLERRDQTDTILEHFLGDEQDMKAVRRIMKIKYEVAERLLHQKQQPPTLADLLDEKENYEKGRLDGTIKRHKKAR